MNIYKNKELNNQLREAVYKIEKYCDDHPDIRRKYLSNDEFTQDVMRICNIPHGMASKVTWFVRGDAQRDEYALKSFGFNKYTA